MKEEQKQLNENASAMAKCLARQQQGEKQTAAVFTVTFLQVA